MPDIIPAPGGGSTPELYGPIGPPHRPQADADAAEAVDLREVLAVLRRHARLILGVTLLIFAGAAYLVYTQQPQYLARAVIRLQDQRQALTGGIQGTAAVEQVLGKKNDPLLSQIQIMRSRGAAGAVVDGTDARLQSRTRGFSVALLRDVAAPPEVADTLTLDVGARIYRVRDDVGPAVSAPYGRPVRAGGVRLTVTERPEGISEAEIVLLPRSEAIDQLLENLRVTPRAETDVVDVEYTAPDPVRAQRVVNAAVEEFQARNAESAQQQSRRRRMFIEDQLEKTDSVLAQAQLALTKFRERQQVFSSRQQFSTQQASIMGLEVRRQEIDADRRMYESLLAGLTLAPEGQSSSRLQTLVSSPGIASNPVIAQLYEQLVRYETTSDSLTTGAWASAPNSPDVQRVRALARSTRAKLVDAVRSHVAALGARVAALDELKARNTAQMSGLPATEAEEARLAQRVETARSVADQLREEYQKARIAEAVEVGQVEIVDRAAIPSKPVGSGRGLKLVLGLVVGLMLGSGAAFLREHLDTAIQHREDVERALGVPSLAVIPRIASTPHRSRLALARGRRQSGDDTDRPASLVAATDLRSSGAEAYRSLRTNLIFSQAVQMLRTVVVTSASPGEGKTTTAANLAVAFAQQGMRVLLVDCDLRKAKLHRVFSLPREPGLTEVVLGHVPPEEAIRGTTVDRLSVLPSGTLPPNPSELLGGQRMRDLLRVFSQSFDLVVLDTAPLLATTDAAVLGTQADGVLLVVRAGGTDRGAAQQALQQLRHTSARVVGAVLNDPDARVPQYGGYYYHDYYGDGA